MKIALIIILLALLFTNIQAGGIEWKSQLQIKLPAEAEVLSYSADGSRIAVGHSDGRVSVWNVKSGEAVLNMETRDTKRGKSVVCHFYKIHQTDAAYSAVAVNQTDQVKYHCKRYFGS